MTTKPTTSDMTVSKILDDFGSAVVDVALKLYDDPDYKFEKDHDAAHKQALAAIEAHYAAKENRAVKSKEREMRGKYGCPVCRKPNQVAHKDCWKKAVADYRNHERLNNTEEV